MLRAPGHRARKRFGQNFLTSEFHIEKIVSAIAPEPGENIVEIGPGQAALTQRILSRTGAMTAVEIDRDLAAWLKDTFGDALSLIVADALEIDWKSVCPGKKLRVIGNLPYNISTPLLFRLLQAKERIADQHFMLQKEVVDRMVSPPGEKSYGRLSVMLQASYVMTRLFDIPPGAFTPQPKVTSSFVRMVPRPEHLPVNPEDFETVVKAAFSLRRKTIRNSLEGLMDGNAIQNAGIDPGIRAEALRVESFFALTREYSKQKSGLP